MIFKTDQIDFEQIFQTAGIPVIIMLGVLALFLLWLALRTVGRRAASGMDGMSGLIGVVRKTGTFRGFVQVEVRGELWWAMSSHQFEEGQEVRILGSRGMLLRIEPVPDGKKAL